MKRVAAMVVAVLSLVLLRPSPAPGQATGEPPAGPRAIIGDPRGARVPEASLDARTQEVAALLRCPVCQGLSVADSPATMAQKMKVEVREMLAEGYDQDQILTYFERSYGEFVRLKPPLRGVNWLVWLGPGLGLLLGLALVAWALRARNPAVGPGESRGPVPGADTLPDDPSLVPYVLQAREMAYGWPEGRKPADPTKENR
jgi:cytochrome c-type biogenesis protein CcmH